MTSIETLNSIVDKCAIKEYDKNGGLIKWVGTIDKEYLTILQDLEMLDYLLWLIDVKEFKDTARYGEMYLTIRPDARISQEAIKLIKERKEGLNEK